jgi:dienelactone hydrolase
MFRYTTPFFVMCVLLPCVRADAQVPPSDAVLLLSFEKENPDLRLTRGLKVVHGDFGNALEFTDALQVAEIDFSRRLDGVRAMTVGGWFYPRRAGEQSFFCRGVPEAGPNGERMFRPQEKWVDFLLGTDQHGFFLGTVHGNATMPFPFVTLNDVPIDEWSQLVVVKDAEGYQKWYRNGTLVCSDRESTYAPKVRPFVDTVDGEPVRLMMPLGGMIGEAWIVPRELSAEEVRRDFEAKRARYKPALPTEPVRLREMDRHPAADLWGKRGLPLTAENWPKERERILAGVWKVLGPMSAEKVPLDPKVISETDCGTYVRRKVSIQVQPDDRMPAYLLIPKQRKSRVPAVICFYGTTGGAGKETTVGLSGNRPGTPVEKNRDYAVWMAEAGFVALAPDYLRDGERIKPGRRPYDTTAFYERFPDWSVHGKDAWDTSRAVDYLQTLDFVDPDRIGMTGHSYGGHSTIFCTALEPRIKVAVANGPVSDFLHHGMHWAVPRGAGASQSMPGMRPYVLDRTIPVPVTFYEFTSLIAPRPLLVGQAVGERRPMEEENYSAVSQVYRALGQGKKVRYVWYPGDHDYPPQMREAAVDWFRRWFGNGAGAGG